MPPQPRLDARGPLHPVRGRGSERLPIVQSDPDRTACVPRLATLGQAGQVVG